MNNLTLKRILEFLKRKLQQKRWRRVVTCLSALVVFVTTYALILPAISMTKGHPALSAEQMEAFSGEALTLHVSAEGGKDKGEQEEQQVIVLTLEGEGADLSPDYVFNEEGICLITDEEGNEIELHRTIRELPKGGTGFGIGTVMASLPEDVQVSADRAFAVDYWFTLEAGARSEFDLELVDEVVQDRFAKIIEEVKMTAEHEEREAVTASASNAEKAAAQAAAAVQTASASNAERSDEAAAQTASSSNAERASMSDAEKAAADANVHAANPEETVRTEVQDDGFVEILDGAVVNDIGSTASDEDSAEDDGTVVTANLKLSAGFGDDYEAAVRDAAMSAEKRGDAIVQFTWSKEESEIVHPELVKQVGDAVIAVMISDKESLPEGAWVDAYEIMPGTEEYEAYISRAAGAVSDHADGAAKDVVRARFFDITIRDAAGNEIQPENPVQVVFSYDKTQSAVSDEKEEKAAAEGGGELSVIHFAEDGEDLVAADRVDSGEKEDALAFTAESFSVYGFVYTVDFYYEVGGESFETSITGGTVVSLKDLVQELRMLDGGPTASGSDAEPEEQDEYDATAVRAFIRDINSVEFSDESLIKVIQITKSASVDQLEKKFKLKPEYSAQLTKAEIKAMGEKRYKGPDYILFSLKPFDTEEMLSITMKDGRIIQVKVTDAQLKKEVIAASGDTYEVTVTYGADAMIPEGAELKVREITESEQEYKELQEKAEKQLKNEAEGIPSHPVLFDISIWDGENEIEPAKGSSVTVEVKLQENSVNGMFSGEDSPLLINEEPVPGRSQELRQKLHVIHDKDSGKLEAVDVEAAMEENRIVGQFVTESFSNWLLYLDETLEEITVYTGDSITLRPYGGWYWKKDGEPAELQALEWIFPESEYTTRTGSQSVPIDYSGGKRTYTGIISAKTKDEKFTFEGRAKFDRELKEAYWLYHINLNTTGSFNLHIGQGKTIKVNVIEGEHTDEPGTVQGVENVKVNLFDYDLGGVLDEGIKNGKNNQNLATRPFTDTINGTSYGPLKFLSSGSENNGDDLNQYTNEYVHQGLLDSTLTEDGYPKLASKYDSRQTSLKYLFDTSKTEWVNGKDMIAYPGVGGLFRLDEDGYYSFSSNKNYAYFDQDSNSFKLYEHTYTQNTEGTGGENAKPIGFFPFHPYESGANLNVNQNKNLNHHMGLSMEVEFDIPDNKKVSDEDIVFEFSGDDDMWVFIDDQLVLDIGGIHQPVPGSINFSQNTNNIYVYGEEYKSINFAPGHHTMKVFYLERGGCDSNCSIRFNMPLVIGRGDFTVVKAKAKSDPEKELKMLQGAVFGLWENENCEGDPVRKAESDVNGKVEYPNLSVKTAGQIFYMREISAPDGYRKSNKTYIVQASEEKGPDGKYTFTVMEKDSGIPLDVLPQDPHYPIIYDEEQEYREVRLEKSWKDEYGNVPDMSGLSAKFILHKKGTISVSEEIDNQKYTVRLENPEGKILAEEDFYGGDKVRLNYQFKKSGATNLSLNGVTYALLKTDTSRNPPVSAEVTYLVSGNDAKDGIIRFCSENDYNGKSHDFDSVSWELIGESHDKAVTTTLQEVDQRIATFTLPGEGDSGNSWKKTFSHQEVFDEKGEAFKYWFEEVRTTPPGFIPVTSNGADAPIGESGVQEIKNVKPAAIEIVKVVRGTETPLSGAGFTLVQVDERGGSIEGGIVKPETFTDAKGELVFDGLVPGRYELKETTVPSGFVIGEGPWYIIVDSNYETKLDPDISVTLIKKNDGNQYIVENEPGAELPHTGGPGTKLFSLAGILMVFFAGVVTVLRRI